MISDVRTIEQLQESLEEAVFEDETYSMEAILMAVERIINDDEVEIEEL